MIPAEPASSDGSAPAVAAERGVFGRLVDGRVVEQVVLADTHGHRATIIAFGATLQAVQAPDREGRSADVTLGFDEAGSYRATPRYFGATIGGYANRIAGARFVLDGETHVLGANDGANHLHGGEAGLDRQIWDIVEVSDGDTARVVLRHVGPDGAGGYPGRLTVTAAYSLAERGVLTIAYRATTSRPTVVSLTNHAFFNLSGDAMRSALDHRVMVHADEYLPVDEALIPTGERRAVAGTPFDLRAPAAVSARVRDGRDAQLRVGRGYDHCYVLGDTAGMLRAAARLEDPVSGRVLEIATTAPAMQFYSGNFLDGTVAGKGGTLYRMGDGLCFEPQAFPDAPNRADFPSARLDPGEVYENVIVLRFWVAR